MRTITQNDVQDMTDDDRAGQYAALIRSGSGYQQYAVVNGADIPGIIERSSAPDLLLFVWMG